MQSNLSSYNAKNWKSVDAATKVSNLSLLSLSILNSYNNIFIIHIHFILQDQFKLQGDSNLVTKKLNTKCERLLSSSSNKLH